MIAQKVSQARSNVWVKRAAQTAIIVALLVTGWTFNDRIDATESETAVVNGVLARSCGAATFAELREQGLVEECRLAQRGDLVDAIPDSVLPKPDAQPSDVAVDVVKDDDTSTPADVQQVPAPGGPTNAQVATEVDDWFDENPLLAQPGYQRAIQRTVGTYLTANPPADGRPPTEREIAGAVRAALLANPPADGTDGEPGDPGDPGDPGRGVASTSLDGCDIIFTFNDGSNVRIGPICGEDGQPGPAPTDNQIAQAVAAYCTSNGECRGPAGPAGAAGADGQTGATGPEGPPGSTGVVQTLDNCQPPDGEVVVDVDISGPIGDPLTIILSCKSAPGLIPDTPGGVKP